MIERNNPRIEYNPLHPPGDHHPIFPDDLRKEAYKWNLAGHVAKVDITDGQITSVSAGEKMVSEMLNETSGDQFTLSVLKSLKSGSNFAPDAVNYLSLHGDSGVYLAKGYAFYKHDNGAVLARKIDPESFEKYQKFPALFRILNKELNMVAINQDLKKVTPELNETIKARLNDAVTAAKTSKALNTPSEVLNKREGSFNIGSKPLTKALRDVEEIAEKTGCLGCCFFGNFSVGKAKRQLGKAFRIATRHNLKKTFKKEEISYGEIEFTEILRKKTQYDSQMKDLKVQEEVIKESLELAKNNLRDASTALTNAVETWENTKAEEKLQNQKVRLMDAKSKIKEKIETITTQIEAKNRDIKKLQEDKLDALVKVIRDEKEVLKPELLRLQKSLVKLDSLIKRVESDYQESREEIVDCETKLSFCENENKFYSNALAENQAQINELSNSFQQEFKSVVNNEPDFINYLIEKDKLEEIPQTGIKSIISDTKVQNKEAQRMADSLFAKSLELNKELTTDKILKQDFKNLSKNSQDLTLYTMYSLLSCRNKKTAQQQAIHLVDTAYILAQKGDYHSSRAIMKGLQQDQNAEIVRQLLMTAPKTKLPRFAELGRLFTGNNITGEMNGKSRCIPPINAFKTDVENSLQGDDDRIEQLKSLAKVISSNLKSIGEMESPKKRNFSALTREIETAKEFVESHKLDLTDRIEKEKTDLKLWKENRLKNLEKKGDLFIEKIQILEEREELDKEKAESLVEKFGEKLNKERKDINKQYNETLSILKSEQLYDSYQQEFIIQKLREDFLANTEIKLTEST